MDSLLIKYNLYEWYQKEDERLYEGYIKTKFGLSREDLKGYEKQRIY